MALKWVEKKLFEQSLTSTKVFRNIVRPAAYALAGGDPERVHELVLEKLNDYEDIIAKHADEFDFPELHVEIAGKKVMPFGPAAGLDKNGDVLYPLSHIFGFLVPGTVVVNPRKGNDPPRVVVDENKDEIYNAQGFPSKGLDYFLNNIRAYRERGGEKPVIVSICGIPPDEHSLDVAYRELEKLLDEINPYADGFIWNPFSPNTEAIRVLRTPEHFKRSAELMGEKVGEKLKKVKMGPYDHDEKPEWLDLVGSFMEGGGDGIVGVNTFMVPKEKVPSKDWGYPSAGRSGPFLRDYRMRAVKGAREAYPDAFIDATGGIHSPEQAWEALQYADVLKGYTPYTFHGFGLVIEMAEGVKLRLEENGYKTLAEYQAARRKV